MAEEEGKFQDDVTRRGPCGSRLYLCGGLDGDRESYVRYGVQAALVKSYQKSTEGALLGKQLDTQSSNA